MTRFRTPANIRWLLVMHLVALSTRTATAQCPAGSIINGTGTITNGQTTCITSGVSTDVQLNNGSVMVIISGGNYTGNLSSNNGASIQVQPGGQLAPNQANSFSASLTNNGIVVFNNISLSGGAAITNSGSFTWAGSWNQNSAITVTNTACGTMNYSQGTGLGSNGVIVNDGVLNFSQGFTMNNGTILNNRGRVNVTGDINLAGTFYNQHIAVFRGSNNNISSNSTSDSLVNLGKITVTGSITTSIATRNDGLMVVNGSYTINGGVYRINNTTAQLRIGGSFSNNGQVRGNGGLHIGGSISNNQTIAGFGGGLQRLTVNKNSPDVPGTTNNLNFNTGLAAGDTGTYNPPFDNPASCAVLPVRFSSLQAAYNNGQVQLNWLAYGQSATGSFTIEYSQDGRSFTKAGELAATGTNDHTTPYVYKHMPALSGTLFYRVRETTPDGTMYYSNMVVVKTGNTFLAGTDVFPNPFTETLQISMQLEKTGMIQVALYDASGRLVRRSHQTGVVGRNTIVMGNLSALLPGVYLLQIKAGEHISFEKLTK
ncbi:T9SS type A sorting domain-containing protein [Niastella populi]|uniref:Secretion system C-terminal sorting domain-containing protein n=1 Tax=Niastella populi TaxID=550983 RepID=A0A1V9FGN9_9BACT|nr:T9SS type A sorting domain-containing protein [Niastella populi]OQP57525.1 hypothetical protein A4R26_24450 [Niastella populi]